LDNPLVDIYLVTAMSITKPNGAMLSSRQQVCTATIVPNNYAVWQHAESLKLQNCRI